MSLPAVIKTSRSKLKRAISRAKSRLHTHAKERRGTRIGFVVDATGSRVRTWKEAQVIQARMFKSLQGQANLELRLMWFGGGRMLDLGWGCNPNLIAKEMADTRCITGLTQYVKVLTAILDDNTATQADAAILIGDAFEEELSEVETLARCLAGRGIKLFTFLEGNNHQAKKAFKAMAEITGGKFARFGEDLPLSDLCQAVALLSCGQQESIKQLGNEQVTQLLLPNDN